MKKKFSQFYLENSKRKGTYRSTFSTTPLNEEESSKSIHLEKCDTLESNGSESKPYTYHSISPRSRFHGSSKLVLPLLPAKVKSPGNVNQSIHDIILKSTRHMISNSFDLSQRAPIKEDELDLNED